jgi:hypothetical protein
MSSALPAESRVEGEVVPPLVDGQRLTREEFHRRYEAMPEVKKAELIEGVVHVPSPVRDEHHGEPHAELMGWLWVYRANTPGVRASDNATLLLEEDEPQPDGLLRIDPRAGGQARVNEEGYLVGGPELVAEVSASSASFDLGAKLRVYQSAGVREYVVWRVLDGEVDWFVLREGQFLRQAPHADGTLRSETLPGLWLDPSALVRLESGRVLGLLQQGLASPEHATFVQDLQRRRTASAGGEEGGSRDEQRGARQCES